MRLEYRTIEVDHAGLAQALTEASASGWTLVSCTFLQKGKNINDVEEHCAIALMSREVTSQSFEAAAAAIRGNR